MEAKSNRTAVNTFGNVEPLLKQSLLSVVGDVKNNMEGISILPSNLKNNLAFIMSKRGLITDENIEHVLNERIRVLDLSECDVTDSALQYLYKCPQLNKIDLNSAKISRTTITTAGVAMIARHCLQLQIVYLRRCLSLTDEGIVSLAQSCRQLRELNVGGCHQLTDRSLEALGHNCNFLKCVNFAKTSITDDGIISLVSGCCANTLKEVHMDGCVDLTDEAVEGILNFCPNMTILLFHGCPQITDRSRQALEEIGGSRSHMKQVTWTVY